MLIASNNSFGQHIDTSGTPITGDIYHLDGNIGIGTNTPQKALTIMKMCEDPLKPVLATIRLNSGFNDTINGVCINSIWDIENKDNLFFKYSINEINVPTTKMLLTKDGQLALGTETPNASAILQLNATNKGVLLPKLTTAQRDAIVFPANGLLIYNIDINKFSYYDAGTWHNIAESNDFDNYLTITAFNNSIAGAIIETDTTNWNNAYSQINSLDASELVVTDTEGNLTSFNNGTSEQYLSTNNSGQLEWKTIEIPQASETFWERTGNKTYLKSSNDNVGIGTNNPQTSLHVFRNFANDFIQIQPATVRLENYYKKEGFYAWNMEADRNNFNLKYSYNLKESPQESETKFSFTEEGNFGIGTKTPQANIHIKDTESQPTIRLEGIYDNTQTKQIVPVNWDIRLNGTNLMFDYKDLQNRISFGSSGEITTAGNIVTSKTVNAQKFKNTNNTFSVDENGNLSAKTITADNVGIGTTNPNELFSVNNNFTVNQYGVVSAKAIKGNSANDYFELSSFNDKEEGGAYMRLYNNGNFNNVIGLNADFNIFRYKGSNTWENLFKIDVDGNVTISKSLWVKEDIWIQGGKPDGWADFVFEQDYDLMPLSELETYITANKHLPEVPSAEEIGDNGFKLAEMDALQMQKIEELTLYILQLQEQITEMQKEINELKK